MKLSDLNILTVINILFYSRKVMIATFAISSVFIISAIRRHLRGSLEITFLIALIVLSFIAGYYGRILLKNYFVSKSKYPSILNIACNVLGISKSKISSEPISLDLDQFIKDNNLSLTYYYINNPTYLILGFNKNKIRYFTQEYDWENFKWDFYIRNDGRNTIEVLEFRGFNQNNRSIKDQIEFEKINAKEHEVLILFIVHDLLFGKGLSRYY